MNHGGLGYISEAGRLFLPPDLVDKLSIGEDSALFGVYYSSADSGGEADWPAMKHDFLFTPIPPRFWTRSVLFVIRTWHRPQALLKVAEIITEVGASILHSETTRAGHRYGTWSLHVVFEASDPGEYNPQKTIHTGTYEAAQALKNKLEEDAADVLFSEGCDTLLKEAVEWYPHTALAYFNHHRETRASREPNKEWYKTIHARCVGPGELETDNTQIPHIVSRSQALPTAVHASLDTKFLNLRVGLIPTDRLARFIEIHLDYHRAGDQPSAGLMAEVTGRLGRDFNLWRLYNFAISNYRAGEEGAIVMLAEWLGEPVEGGPASIAEQRLGSGDAQFLPPHIQLRRPAVLPVDLQVVKNLLRDEAKARQRYRHDVFISYSMADGTALAQDLANRLRERGLIPFMGGRQPGGVEFTDDVRRELLASREVCVVFTPQAIKSTWVASEWGAAWVLGRHVVPIKTVGVELDHLPDQLRHVVVREYNGEQIELYLDEVDLRRRHGLLRRRSGLL
jgi:hypothetical protein